MPSTDLNPLISYAQNFEDVILWRAFSNIRKGFYIDVGAHHPTNDSVSRIFHEKGWRGIHVDASISAVNSVRKERPGDKVIHAAIGETSGPVSFFSIDNEGASMGISTCDPDLANSYRDKGLQVIEQVVPGLTIDSLLEQSDAPEVHWLKIDIEGFEAKAIYGWTNLTVKPWVVIVESTTPQTQIKCYQEWEPKLLDKGYEFVYFDGLNRFYLSKAQAELKNKFTYPPCYFDNFITYRQFKSEREIQRWADRYSKETKKLSQALAKETERSQMRWLKLREEDEREIHSLRNRLYCAPAHKHLYRALCVLAGNKNYCRGRAMKIRKNYLSQLGRDLTQSFQTKILRQETQQRFLIDVTFTDRADNKSGIQRVVRNITRELLLLSTKKTAIVPVIIRDEKLCYASDFVKKLGLPPQKKHKFGISLTSSDTLVLIDSGWAIIDEYRHLLATARDTNSSIVGIIYDIIPILMPEVVDAENVRCFENWFSLLTEHSDRFVCISEAVANEVKIALAKRTEGPRPKTVTHFHLGAVGKEITGELCENTSERVSRFIQSSKNRFLMVGTLEPRKGYDYTLDALDQLLKNKTDVSLCIVGKYGWYAESTQERIENHPEFNRRLFWFRGAHDDELLALYQQSDCLIAASLAEGFGLPLIEAAQNGLPLLCSDIPVFKEVCGKHASFFACNDANDLATHWQAWIEAKHSGKITRPTEIPWLSWQESALQLIERSQD